VINQWHAQASELHIEKEVISKELAVREERFRSLTDQIHAYESDITRLQEEIKSGEESLSDISNEHAEINADLSSSTDKENELKDQIAKIQEQRNFIDKAIKDIRIKISNLETGSIKVKAQIDEKINRRSVIEKIHKGPIHFDH